MSEEAGSSSCFLQRPPVAILRAIVQRDGFLCSGGDPGQSLCNGSASRSSALGGQLGNEHQASLPFNQRVDARCMVATLHRVALPVSDAGTGLYHSRTRLNGRALGLRYSLASACPVRHSALASPAQIHSQILARGPHPAVAISVYLSVDVLVDRFVRDCLTNGTVDGARNLLRGASALELRHDEGADSLILEPLMPAARLSLG